jgi:hypothetical protein
VTELARVEGDGLRVTLLPRALVRPYRELRGAPQGGEGARGARSQTGLGGGAGTTPDQARAR